jgi:hypothetical protein
MVSPELTFTGGNRSIDCLGMARIIMAKGLITALHAGEFNKLGWTASTMPLDDRTVGLSSTKPGDWVYFQNDLRYLQWHGNPDEGYQGENVIKVGTDRYWGWPISVSLGALPYGNRANPRRPANSCWTQILFDAYNSPPVPPNQYTRTIPGYTGTATFFDVAVVGMDIFDLRTGPSGP